MKTSITYTLGVFAILVAIMCGVVILTSDRHSENRHNPHVRPMRVVSEQSLEDQPATTTYDLSLFEGHQIDQPESKATKRARRTASSPTRTILKTIDNLEIRRAKLLRMVEHYELARFDQELLQKINAMKMEIDQINAVLKLKEHELAEALSQIASLASKSQNKSEVAAPSKPLN